MPTKFETPFFANFDDGDPGGIVFFGNYYRIAHRALEQFVVKAGIPWKDWFESKELIAPLVHSEADYMQPLFCGNEYQAQVSVEKIGNSSVVFSYTFLNRKGEPCAKLKTVHVFLNSKDMSKTGVPEEFSKRLNPYLDS